MDYIIVTGKNHDELENTVRRQIERGYEPIGGVAVNTETYRISDNTYNVAKMKSSSVKFYQSMIRRYEEKPTRKEI